MSTDRDKRIAELQASIDEDEHASLTELDELIADRNEDVYAAALELAHTVFRALVDDIAPGLTCEEANTVVYFYEVVGLSNRAKQILESHSTGDIEEDDEHFAGKDQPE